MKLNPDCVRDILLTIEEFTNYDEYLDYPDELDKCSLLKSYSDAELKYHFKQCADAYLIDITSKTIDGHIAISDLTPKGHEFLANIRGDNIWHKTKDVALKIGSFSLTSLTNIATGVISELIRQQLKLS